MSITKEQLKRRKKFICASDVSALFTDDEGRSLNPYANSLDIYTQKIFDLEPDKESDAQRLGNKYEELLIAFASNELGKNIITSPDKLEFINRDILDSNGKPFIIAHLDGYTENKPYEIVECKTTSISSEYGESYTDDIPLHVILQVQFQMLCSNFKKAHIAVLLGRWGLKEELYVVERNESIIDAIKTRIIQFWNGNVLVRIPPPESSLGNIQIFRRIVRTPEKTVEIDGDTLSAWADAKAARLMAEKQERGTFAKVLEILGDAEGATCSDGRLLTFFQQVGADKIDRKTLKTKYPEIYNEVAEETHKRVARLK